MAGIKSTTDSSVQVHDPVETQVGAAPPSKKEQAPAKSRAADAVEKFSGQAPALRSGSGPARQTDKGAAAGGAELAESMKTIRESLDGSFFHWVGDQDLAQAHHALEALGPADYRTAMGSMDKEGLLATYLGKLEPEARNAFLSQAARKGFVETESGSKASGRFAPPDRPETFRNDPKLPPAVRDAVYADARGAARAYCHEFREYLGRYQGAVVQAKSGADLRAIGELAKLDVPSDGMVYGHPDAHKNGGEWLSAREYPSQVGAQKAVSDKLSDLLGEARAGSFSVEATLGFKAAGSSAKYSGKLSDYGKGDLKVELGQRQKIGGLNVGISADTNQNVKGTVGLKQKIKGIDVEAAASVDSNGKVNGKLSVAGTGVAVDSKGRTEMTIGVTKSAKSYAYADRTKGQFGGGVELKETLGDFEVSGRAGVGFQGISKEAAVHALAHGNVGVMGTPAELMQGTPWNDLSERARQMHRRNGWTEVEWSSKLPRR